MSWPTSPAIFRNGSPIRRSERPSSASCRHRARPPRLGRLQDRPGLLQEDRRREHSDARSIDASSTASRSRCASPQSMRHAQSRIRASASADAVSRRGQRRAVPACDPRAHPALRRAHRADDRPLNRRRRPRDALGIRLGARSLRDVGRDRREERGGGHR